MNNVNLLGNLTRDPELRFTPSNNAVCEFGVAINEGKDKTTFVDVTAWGKTAEFVNQYWHKGKQIALTGRLTLDQWDDKQSGQKRSKLKVTAERAFFVGPKDGGQRAPDRDSAPVQRSAPMDDGDIPFAPHGIDGRTGV